MKIIIRFLIVVIIVSASTLFLIGCEDASSELDAEVHVIRTFKSIERGGSVNVRYQVENTSDIRIRGWNIYFRVSMASGQQVEAFNGLTYSLNPGEVSKELLANGKIPDHFDGADQPTIASLQLIELY